MKKINLQFAIIAASLVLAGNVFATATITSTGSTVGNTTFRTSTGVTLMAETKANATAFRVSAKHLSGDKVYSATSAAPSVVESTGTIGTALAAIVPSMP